MEAIEEETEGSPLSDKDKGSGVLEDTLELSLNTLLDNKDIMSEYSLEVLFYSV